MRNGHYTAGDIEGLTVVPPKKGKVQTAYGRVNGVLIWSEGLIYAIGEGLEKKSYQRIEHVPSEYKVVAEIIRKKALGRGGRRIGAGRPKTELYEKKTRSFKLTAYEYMKVKEYIAELRKSLSSNCTDDTTE